MAPASATARFTGFMTHTWIELISTICSLVGCLSPQAALTQTPTIATAAAKAPGSVAAHNRYHKRSDQDGASGGAHRRAAYGPTAKTSMAQRLQSPVTIHRTTQRQQPLRISCWVNQSRAGLATMPRLRSLSVSVGTSYPLVGLVGVDG